MIHFTYQPNRQQSTGKLICNKLLGYVDANNSISSDQHGFCSEKSIFSQILTNLSDWTTSVDNGKLVLLSTMNVPKQKQYQLFTITIRPKHLMPFSTVNCWIPLIFMLLSTSDYLKDRHQAIYINNFLSDLVRAKSIILLCYINDNTKVVLNSTIYLWL